MKQQEYQVMYQVEDTLWWYKGMEAITRAVLERYYPRGSRLKILDAGCGTGGAMGYLADYGSVTGLDFSRSAIEFSRQRNLKRLVRGSVMSLPFEEGWFDLVTSFDVLCTSSVDDRQALRAFCRVLVSGGRVLLRLPAYNWLRAAHDRAVDIARRYTRSDVKARLGEVNLLVEHLSYANMWLLPVAVAKRWSERFFPPQAGSDLALNVGRLNRPLRTILASEARLVAGPGLPFGLTLVAVARKP